MSDFSGKKCDNCGKQAIDNYRGWWAIVEYQFFTLVVSLDAPAMSPPYKANIIGTVDACSPVCVCEKFQKIINKKVNDGIQRSEGGEGGATVLPLVATSADDGDNQRESQPGPSNN